MKSLVFPVGIARWTLVLCGGIAFDRVVNRGKPAHQFDGRGAFAPRKVARRWGIEPGTPQRLEKILSGKPRAIGAQSERGGFGARVQALDACVDRAGDAGEIEKTQCRPTGSPLRPRGPRVSCDIHGVGTPPGRLPAEHRP